MPKMSYRSSASPVNLVHFHLARTIFVAGLMKSPPVVIRCVISKKNAVPRSDMFRVGREHQSTRAKDQNSRFQSHAPDRRAPRDGADLLVLREHSPLTLA